MQNTQHRQKGPAHRCEWPYMHSKCRYRLEFCSVSFTWARTVCFRAKKRRNCGAWMRLTPTDGVSAPQSGQWKPGKRTQRAVRIHPWHVSSISGRGVIRCFLSHLWLGRASDSTLRQRVLSEKVSGRPNAGWMRHERWFTRSRITWRWKITESDAGGWPGTCFAFCFRLKGFQCWLLGCCCLLGWQSDVGTRLEPLEIRTPSAL
jgi:hypothetical protein